jgi:hypothetical protein
MAVGNASHEPPKVWRLRLQELSSVPESVPATTGER